ncbi:MAG: SPFH domain-containing protein [Lachnoclostridium sp.]|nr:SPFH domain-containing protein [Lachnospira sp.]MCM1247980.1 SPFH domain-containing protein [Lachnoclostridium sp.]MCM1535581.1 SPFH domain-containing protein [Clostridium sp.]
MGLIKAAKDAISTMLADQWREYFYCDSLSDDILVVKGQKKVIEGRNSNTKGMDNIISNGSIIAVNEGQCMIIVDQGGVVELCADAGEFIFDGSTEPSLFYGDLGESVKQTFSVIGRRFVFGGNTAKDQRIYFFNTKEIMDNKFGTANPVPFRVVDRNIGLDVDIALRCNGSYSFKLVDPLLFYKNVCGNVTENYTRDKVLMQMKSELLTAMQPALAKISAMGVRYSEVPAHSMELADALNEILSDKWSELRGIEIVSLNLNSVKASEEDEKMIKELQRTAVFQSTGMAAANMNVAQAEAFRNLGKQQGGVGGGDMMGMAMGAMAMNMMGGAMNGGQGMNPMGNNAMGNNGSGAAGAMGAMAGSQMNAQQAEQMNVQPNSQQGAQAPVLGWTCSCGQADNKGKFCSNCGAPKPADAGWTCSCGAVNQGKFCVECGAKKPEGAPLYKCDKCGWEPEDPAHPPKFCPECGDIFDDNDRI